MNVSACLTLAAMYLLVWFRERRSWAYLCFFVMAVGVVGLAVGEMAMMYSKSPAEFGRAARWAHLDNMFVVAGSLGFVHFYFGTGKRWLLWSALGLRLLAVVANFSTGLNLHTSAIQSLQSLNFLGERVSVLGEWTPNPWVRLGQLAALAQFAYVVDASLRLWRFGPRESRRRAIIVGGTLAFFMVFAAAQPGLVAGGVLQTPIIVSFPFLAVLLAMGYELSRDVLRAAQLGRELRESEEQMKLAVDATNFGLWIRDFTRNEIWASEAWRKLFGFTSTERLELEGILEKVHPEDRESVRQTLANAPAGTGTYETEYRLRRPDGGIRWIASQGRVEFDAKRQPMLIRGASGDITKRKVAEIDAQRLQQEITHVGRVSMMGQLASSLAHEINQPLGAILRNAEAAELFLENESPDLEEIRAILADIRKDDERAGAVIDRMRALLKHHELDPRSIDLAEVVTEVAALARADATARSIKLDMVIPDTLPPVLGDRVHLQQVLLNLILNGMDALGDASHPDRRVTLMARLVDAQFAEVEVRDGGHGIPAETLARIFNPFFTTKLNGMGMGLAISRTIIEAHGGRLWAENNVHGGGATFRFTVPLAAEGIT